MKPSKPAPTMSQEVVMQVVVDHANRVSLSATLTYSLDDPYAASATFRTGDGDITWTFARDLLKAGMTEPSGEGDIHIRPGHPSRGPIVVMTLSSPSGAAKIEASRHDIGDFVAETYRVCPEGSEWMHLNLDRTIDDLLADPML